MLKHSTRPELFDEKGSCNACQWSEEKIRLEKRLLELENILSKHKNKSTYDCIIPVSGGKDGTYVTDQLKNRYNIKLCV